MVIMHTCDNPPCVNPRHLRQNTPQANNDDKVAKGRHAQLWGTPLRRSQQTHCRRGHPFDETNTRIMKSGHRRCKACERNQRSQLVLETEEGGWRMSVKYLVGDVFERMAELPDNSVDLVLTSPP